MASTRVVVVPQRHPYVDAVLDGLPDVVDALPRRRDGLADPWAPDPVLDPSVLEAVAGAVDVVHLHFGYESWTPAQARRWLEVLRRHGVGLVLTVHDLHNPHQRDPSAHRALLDVLVPAADHVITLTEGAAAVLLGRWDRRAEVVPHPPVAPAARTRTAPADGVATAGIHLKSLRANVVDPVPVVAAAARGAARVGGRLRVDAHDDVAQHPDVRAVAALAPGLPVDLSVHGRFDDEALLDYLAGLAVAVLPYRFGTHSGWLEACRDVGTTVVAPSCGFYGDQWDRVLTYGHDDVRGLDGDSLSDAVALALTRPAPEPERRHARDARLRVLREVHGRAYARLAGRPAHQGAA